MTWLRIIQLFGPSFCVTYLQLWPTNETLSRIFSYISVFWNIVPPEFRMDACQTILIIYSVFFILFYTIMVSSSFYYKKNAKLPKAIPPVISFMMATVGYYLHPVATAHAFEAIGYYINGGKDGLVVNAVFIVLYFLILIVYFWLLMNTSISIEFRIYSLQCLLYLPQIQVLGGTIIVTALSTISTHLPFIAKVVTTFLMAIVYILLTVNRFVEGGFISQIHNIVFATTTISCAIISVFCGIQVLAQKPMQISFVFIIVVVVIIVAILMMFLEKNRVQREMIYLDELLEGTTDFLSTFKNVRRFLRMLITGFSKAHPICVNFQVFNDATENWNTDIYVWAAYLKFLAIHAEFANQVALVCQRIMSLKLTGYLIKNILHQSQALMKSRDVNLSPELKQKLAYLSKKVQATKHKMRHIWDLVIQGNLNEMDKAIESCCKSVDSCTTEYDHVVHQYSNNRFIARSYMRFCHEILANHSLTIEWYDKTRMLQRGINMQADSAHELGLEAFPLLPPVEMGIANKQNTDFESSIAIEGMDLEEEGANQSQIEQGNTLSETINKLQIPSIKIMNILRFITILVLFFVPVLFFSFYLPTVVNDLISPLEFIYTLSYLRCIGFQVAIVGHHYVLETIPEKLLDHVERDRDVPISLGSSYDPSVQLHYLLKIGTNMLQTLSQFSSFMIGEKTMDAARETIFGKNMQYIFFRSRGDRETLKTSLQVGMMDVINQLYLLLELEPITKENPNPANPLDATVLNTSKILNSVQNAETFGNFIIDSLDLITTYMQERNKQNKNLFIIFLIAFSAVYLLAQFLLTWLGLRAIRKDKTNVYKCLTALPKNVVSNVVEYLRVIQKDKEHSTKGTTTGDEIDMNKQEDNVLKILMTGDSSGGVKSELMIIILTCIHCGLFLIFTIYVCLSMISKGNYLVSEAPHVDYLLGAYTYDAATVLATDLMLGEFYNLSTDFTIPTLLTRFDQRLQRSQDYYARLLYGDTSEGIKPFQAFAEGLAEATQKMACDDISSKPPETVYDGYKCIRPDVMFYIHHYMVLSLTLPVKQINSTIDKSNPMIPEIYDCSLMLLYENFFFPIFDEVVKALTDSFEESINPILAVSYIMFILAFILEIIVLMINQLSKKYMIFAMRMLMHCPIQAVHQCQKVQRVLSGDFSTMAHENTLRNEKFFDSVLYELPKAVAICDLQGNITHSNLSLQRLFGRDDFVGKNVKEILGSESPKEFNVLSAITKPIEHKIVYKDQNNQSINLVVGIRNTHSMIVVTFTDITPIVRYNTLISEEKKKSDALLTAILPASLVPRVQKGETDISFAVQSASIMFTDIVEFTPWCGSNTGAVVMSTLNALFKEFDLQLAKYSTMTKIKCIGDCYMAAGGIFSEVNQPSAHASDAVNFGLDVISSVLKINDTLGKTLRIRVGVNTGGPIVAGVLGVGKPTFEILGPAINMAQQMEHHGVPMKVHISRSVYELIYGGQFKIKERGNIEVKNGTVRTYLVSNDEQPTK
ncbi:Adenylate and Guanylate cyclase catalytic domain containing protein [Tritrichomonas foetus]|uniref:Adenylate and Guanylate cyclase catalytic domain containing protein n=1 Tax=Tritrichomonas foetus TaxID=1144522 RepID=A0A1J4JR66_9EUKA|nr:Adenylate and Guanylate cyclase catalytic domain containing protein [Tritrichomonas foetus]|eukprot:OHT01531.1 Adenylate and Guanylate cyclase catalytic domain containing protein [Tritrichomonas foetus]